MGAERAKEPSGIELPLIGAQMQKGRHGLQGKPGAICTVTPFLRSTPVNKQFKNRDGGDGQLPLRSLWLGVRSFLRGVLKRLPLVGAGGLAMGGQSATPAIQMN